MEQGRLLLEKVTEFPKAGNINWRVVEFMQACVRLWERSGYQQSEASQAIKVSAIGFPVPRLRATLTNFHPLVRSYGGR